MSVWTIKPEDVKVELVFRDVPFWIKLKKFLTVGEERRVMTSGWKAMSKDADIQIDWQAQSFGRTEVYLTEWSLRDDKDKALPISRDVIESLDPDLFKLIETAINEHVTAVGEEKKLRDGKP